MSLTEYISSLFDRRGRKIQIRQGLSVDFDDSKLDVGELGFLLDTNDVRIGKADGTTMSILNGGSGIGGGITIADIPNSSTTERGLMTSQQFIKLNGVETGANFTFVENVLNSTSTENALSSAMGKKLKDDADALELRVQTIELNGTGSTITLNNTLTSTSTTQGATANVIRIVNDSLENHKSKIASTEELGHIKIGNNVDITNSGAITIKNASTVNKGVVQLVDDLVTNDSSKAATAKTVYELKLQLDDAIISGGGNVTAVVNNLDSTSGTDALSAGMGNFIKQELENKANQSDLEELDEFVRENVVTNGVPVTQNEKDEWNSKSNFSGDYNDLTNKPQYINVINSFTSTSTTDASSANVVRILSEQINSHSEDETIHITTTDRYKWDNKADDTLANQISHGLMSRADKAKLDNISANATYTPIVNSLNSNETTYGLSANQGKVLNEKIIALQNGVVPNENGGSNTIVEDTLESTSSLNALSANQGRVLREMVEAKVDEEFVESSIQNMIDTQPTAIYILNEISGIMQDDDALEGLILLVGNKADKTLVTYSKDGLMSKLDKIKLDGIEESANYTKIVDNLTTVERTSALSANQGKVINDKIISLESTINNLGEGTGGSGSVTKEEIESLLTGQITSHTHKNATMTEAGFMSPSQVVKLNSITTGANFVKVEDSFTSTSSTDAASANTVKELYEEIQLLKSQIESLQNQGGTGGSNSTWNQFEF